MKNDGTARRVVAEGRLEVEGPDFIASIVPPGTPIQNSQEFEVAFQAASEAPKTPRRWYLRIGHRRLRFAAIMHPSASGSGMKLTLASPVRETTRNRPAKGARIFARRQKARKEAR